MSQKGFSKTRTKGLVSARGVIWILVVVIVVIAGGVLTWQQLQPPAEEPAAEEQPSGEEAEAPQEEAQPPADETANSSAKASPRPSEAFGEGGATEDWETYRNEEWGFEIKYPSNWEFGGRGCVGVNPCIKSFEIIEISSSPTITNLTYWLHIEIFDNSDNLSVKEWLYKFKKLEELEKYEGFSFDEIKIGDNTGFRLYYVPTARGYGRDKIYWNKGELIYAMTFNSPYGVPEPPKIPEIIFQMLSSFRFLDPVRNLDF